MHWSTFSLFALTILLCLAEEQTSELTTYNSDSSVPVDDGVERTPAQKAFIVGVAVLLILALVSLGCKLDYKIIWKNARSPVNLLVGMTCQFLLMPLITFAIIKSTRLGWIAALGLFSCSISPGGGASNLYTEMFCGDVELSAVMTFVSSLTAFGTVPLWLLFMKKFILPEDFQHGNSTIKQDVPFAEITRSLASLLVPLMIGLALRRFLPNIADKAAKVVRYLSVTFLAYVIIVGFIAYSQIFRDLDWKLVVCSVILPWIGFTIGGVVSTALRRKKEQAIAISLETGIQNTGIAIFIIERLMHKEGVSSAMISPIFYALSTPIPIMICFGLRIIIQKVRNKKIAKESTSEL